MTWVAERRRRARNENREEETAPIIWQGSHVQKPTQARQLREGGTCLFSRMERPERKVKLLIINGRVSIFTARFFKPWQTNLQ